MNESSISLPTIEGRISGIAFDVYIQMLENSKLTHSHICSICAKLTNEVRRGHFHGSEFGQCFRKTQLDLVTPKEEYSNQKLIEFNDGHLHEETIIKLLEHSYSISHQNTEKIIERRITLDGTKNSIVVKIVLHTDGILELVSLGKRIIIECKSVKNWFWKNRLLTNQIPISYYGQAQCYMEAYNVDYCFLLFKNRESSEIYRPLIIKRDQVYINRRFNYLAGIVYSNSLPEMVPKEYENKKCDACKFCRHFKTCWE